MRVVHALFSRAASFRLWQAALFATLCLVAQAHALDISIPDREIDSGKSIEIPVHATDALGLSALQMSVAFDGKAVELQGVTAGPILTNALVDFKVSDGICTIAFATTEAVKADGDLLLLKIRGSASVNRGSVLAPENVRAWSGDGGQPMKVSLRPGHLSPRASKRLLDWRYLAVPAAAIVGALALAWQARRKKGPPTPAIAPAGLVPPRNAGPHFCSACGASLSPGDNFCSNCGIKIEHAAGSGAGC